MTTSLLEGTTHSLKPGELSGLFELKRFGLNLIDIKICPSSPLRGQQYNSLDLPTGVRTLCIMRRGYPILSYDDTCLSEGDRVILLSNNEEETRRFFMFGPAIAAH